LPVNLPVTSYQLTSAFVKLEGDYVLSLQVNSVQSELAIEPQPRNNIQYIRNWITKEIVINKKILRLRAHLYLKIHWIETAKILNGLLEENDYCYAPGTNQWITLRKYLDTRGNWIAGCNEVFRNKNRIYRDWLNVTQSSSYNAELTYKRAFEEVGYTVELRKLIRDDQGDVQLDLYCIKDDLLLGVQVKNGNSDVFHDPQFTNNWSETYLTLRKEFRYCHRHNIIPILIAPFTDHCFYDFAQTYQGLQCQTFLQLLDKEQVELAKAIKKTLRFGNIRATDDAPDNVKRWISRIPQMWANRYLKN
jgi:hypothetical protein